MPFESSKNGQSVWRMKTQRKIAIGAHVKHERFGTGEVIGTSKKTKLISVRFENGIERQIDRKFLKRKPET